MEQIPFSNYLFEKCEGMNENLLNTGNELPSSTLVEFWSINSWYKLQTNDVQLLILKRAYGPFSNLLLNLKEPLVFSSRNFFDLLKTPIQFQMQFFSFRDPQFSVL
jgi:hypothetical protein